MKQVYTQFYNCSKSIYLIIKNKQLLFLMVYYITYLDRWNAVSHYSQVN